MLLTLLLLFVCLGCLSTRNNGLQEDVILFYNVRNKINVVFHNHKVYSLSGIVLLIGVIGKFPDVTTSQMKEYLFERDPSFLL
ncbi:exported protein of unknown function [Candidatus Methylomirabilis oxygeniifera]|uniref:Uncharacterized protein n=1 Tax=Methylomirabilis oxygeniifera TaxID=671143 RepID=D5MLR0_METO1|nr:exported protein of unknown function [Candidatus Methylomirabilis oxyfera]